jgi:hypothetical protein
MKLIIKIFNDNHLFNIPDDSDNKLELLLNLIEDKIKISDEFYRLEYAEKMLDTEEDINKLSNNSLIELVWKVKYFEEDLTTLYVFDKEYRIPESIILESVVIKMIACNSDDEDNIKIDDPNDKLIFNTRHINKNSINHWINLSSKIKEYLNDENKKLSELKIPKPLQNKKLYYYIGSRAHNYLDVIDFESLQKLATFTDFLDISYLLEIVCAFIAEKYIKNNSIDNIKKLFDNIEV